MPYRRYALALPLLALAAVAVPGCKDDPGGRQAVSGEVTFKEQPLGQGTIQFLPPDTAKDATPGVAQIRDGKYELPKPSGLRPGPYRVVISAGSTGAKVKENEPPGESGPPPKELIPPDWNVNSKQGVDVRRAGPNKFDFFIP